MEQQTILADHDRQFSWHNYNESQTKEKALFVNILLDIANLIREPTYSRGRKPTKTKDIIFAIVLKQYLNLSSRRLQSDLRMFRNIGFIESEIPFNTLLDHLERGELKNILRELVEISALSLKQIEQDFAIDSTGFSTSLYKTFFNMKHNGEGRWRIYRKCHAVCGVKTNIITSVEITEGHANDSPQFTELAKDTARNFKIREFSADKAYVAVKHYNLIDELGGKAYIPFKKNCTGRGRGEASYGRKDIYRHAFEFFKEHREKFLTHYHKRSNIESCFSMIKRKFGNNVKCKKEISQDNEILAKVLAHNICVLIQEIFLNNIEVNIDSRARGYVARK